MGLIADVRLLMQLKRTEKKYGTTSTPANPLVHLFGYEKSFGKPAPHDFNRFVGDFNSWAFACGYRNGFSLAKVPLKLYKKVSSGQGQSELEEITDHPFLELMRNVNPHFNRFEIMVLLGLFLDVTGNSYWWLVKDALRVPRAIWNIPAHWMSIVPSKDNFIEGYVMTVPGRGDKVPFEPDEIIHFKYPSIFSLYYGCPPMYGASYDIALNKHIKTFGVNFLMNNAQPSGVLQTEESLTDTQYKRLQTLWNMKYRGSENAGKMAILEKGLKYQKIGSSLGDMKFDKVDKSIRDGILAIFGVPASKLGLVEDVNRANADANDYTYQKETIVPRLALIEEKLNEKFMPLYGNAAGELIVKFEDPVPRDKEFKLRQRTEHVRAGITSIDEERIEQGLDAYELPETSTPLIPFNVTPAGSGEEAGTAPKKELLQKEIKSRRRRKWEIFVAVTGPQERMFASVMKRFFEAQKAEVMSNLNKYRSYSKQVKAGFEANIIFIMNEENARLKGISKPHIDEAYKSGVSLGYQELGAALDFDLIQPNIMRAVENRIIFFAEKVNENTVQLLKEAIEAGIAAGESIDMIGGRIGQVFDFSESYRSKRIAQTEVIGAANSGQIEGYIENGVDRKMWITARDEKVRSSHLIDGQTVDVEDDFTLNSGVQIQYPGDRSGAAPVGEVVNCRCCVSPVVKKE